MKKLKHKEALSKESEINLIPQETPYEIVFADPRDEEINLKFLKKSQISARMARWFLDQEYNQLIWSDGVFEILELDPRKYGANYDSFIEMVHPEDRDLKNQTQENLKKTYKPLEINYRLLFNDGRIKWINEICNTDFDQEGHPIRSYGTIQDITKYKLTEENFRQKEEQFQSLIESIPSGIAIIQDNKFAFINSAGRKLFGENAEKKFDGNNISNIVHPESETIFQEKIKSVLQGNTTPTFEVTLVHANGTSFTADVTMIQTSYQEKPAIQLIANDISARKNIENALHISEDKYRLLAENLSKNESRLKDIVDTKDKFFSLIAHDLRSPFNSILGFLDLLQSQYEMFNDTEKKNYLKLIDGDTKKTLKLLDNLLEWANVQTGQISFEPTKQKLLPIVRNVEETLESALKLKMLKLDYNIPDKFEVFADANMLTTILRNLISNAKKYSHLGGVITLSVEAKDDFIEIGISDTGIGMNEETRKKIFLVNGQVSTPGTANEVGSGLGLILCKEFVEKHDGTIWVESEEGIGSKFILRLPF
jgi:PAS domain S-box-containing protein